MKIWMVSKCNGYQFVWFVLLYIQLHYLRNTIGIVFSCRGSSDTSKNYITATVLHILIVLIYVGSAILLQLKYTQKLHVGLHKQGQNTSKSGFIQSEHVCILVHQPSGANFPWNTHHSNLHDLINKTFSYYFQ